MHEREKTRLVDKYHALTTSISYHRVLRRQVSTYHVKGFRPLRSFPQRYHHLLYAVARGNIVCDGGRAATHNLIYSPLFATSDENLRNARTPAKHNCKINSTHTVVRCPEKTRTTRHSSPLFRTCRARLPNNGHHQISSFSPWRHGWGKLSAISSSSCSLPSIRGAHTGGASNYTIQLGHRLPQYGA